MSQRTLDDLLELAILKEKFEATRRVYLDAVKAEGKARDATCEAGHDMVEAKDRLDALRKRLNPEAPA